ncbi:hypothetical protein KDL29_13520 [bacterium]|nr:hypothetical protein [bacterium]MCB1221753.1 hypothetical protein [bacterium]UNM08008.1 MAG: hypothetical protein H7A35_14300 [Planctomycetales bacterium]
MIQADGMLSGKPSYAMVKLRQLDNRMLPARLERIDNQMARSIATEVWEEFHRMWSVDHPEGSKQYRSLQYVNERDMQVLYDELERLRQCSFGALVLEGPQILRERWDELHPMFRLLMRPPAGKRSSQAGRDLLDYSELLTGQRNGIPGVLIRNALRYGAILSLVILPLALIASMFWNSSWVSFVPMPGILYLFIYMSVLYRVESRQYMNALALYISFTDEFVEEGDVDAG